MCAYSFWLHSKAVGWLGGNDDMTASKQPVGLTEPVSLGRQRGRPRAIMKWLPVVPSHSLVSTWSDLSGMMWTWFRNGFMRIFLVAESYLVAFSIFLMLSDELKGARLYCPDSLREAACSWMGRPWGGRGLAGIPTWWVSWQIPGRGACDTTSSEVLLKPCRWPIVETPASIHLL